MLGVVEGIGPLVSVVVLLIESTGLVTLKGFNSLVPSSLPVFSALLSTPSLSCSFSLHPLSLALPLPLFFKHICSPSGVTPAPVTPFRQTIYPPLISTYLTCIYLPQSLPTTASSTPSRSPFSSDLPPISSLRPPSLNH